jgi:hypothetical protein
MLNLQKCIVAITSCGLCKGCPAEEARTQVQGSLAEVPQGLSTTFDAATPMTNDSEGR